MNPVRAIWNIQGFGRLEIQRLETRVSTIAESAPCDS